MDLLDTKSMTAQEKYTIMLEERLAKLEDDVYEFKQNTNKKLYQLEFRQPILSQRFAMYLAEPLTTTDAIMLRERMGKSLNDNDITLFVSRLIDKFTPDEYLIIWSEEKHEEYLDGGYKYVICTDHPKAFITWHDEFWCNLTIKVYQENFYEIHLVRDTPEDMMI